MPDEMNVLKLAKGYDGDNILAMINDSLLENSQPKYEKMLNNCFYYNDGKSAQRAADFIYSLN